MRRYKRRCLLFINVAIVLIPLVNCAPMLSSFDIWDDKNGTEYESFFDNVIIPIVPFEHLPRVLNFFPVPFEEECLSTDRRRKGVCSNAYECKFQGGTSHGKCALGFGVCCIFTTTCNSEVFNNLTYFVNPHFPDLSTGMTSCSTTIKKIDPEIAQYRLDFIHFNLGQPNRSTGVCDDDVFILSGGVSKDLRICGINSGQHVYYDVENINETVTITMMLGNKVLSRLWEVRVTQIPFTERAPSGCLQYHLGTTGIIQTMNFADNGRHLADQDYNICMRQELGMCAIAYEPCHENSFKIGTNSNNATTTNDDADVGSGDGTARMDGSCNDRITMPCDSEDLLMEGDIAPGFCNLGFCGSSFCPNGEKTCRIESTVTPFTVGVQFGSTARQESPDENLGMCLKYEQLACAL
ncbi:hypothetical protein PPYR_13319 [Photinus pyralis]|uniref:CUB domain-containing protein n=1 Tax=Photinus pyralis TaxID=7054 RepID=A0A5N4A8S6_PHOPY|nr:uncharacterized protein LOC116179143 [Photinus pyralis]KAB0793699.1 hypothetical protein PPYR_13319 [Photinus pyralis]